MSDQIIHCIECGNDFTWNDEEQTFYQMKGLLAPKRCRDCRRKRRAELNARSKTK